MTSTRQAYRTMDGSTETMSSTASNPEDEARAAARQAAIAQYQKAQQDAAYAQLMQMVAQVLVLAIQFRAVGGSAAGRDLGPKMREAADFLEDL